MIKLKDAIIYIVKYLLPVAGATISIIAFLNTSIDSSVSEAMKDQLAPINTRELINFEYDLKKQIKKIESGSDDLKITDLEKIVILYSTFSKSMKDPAYDEQVDFVRNTYREKMGAFSK